MRLEHRVLGAQSFRRTGSLAKVWGPGGEERPILATWEEG